MLSWEYPPLVVGGISAHADGLARALVRAGHEVTVLTMHHPEAPDDAVVDGVRVLRARTELPWLPDDHFVAHMAGANHHLVALAARLGGWRPDVVHAHDWLVAWAGHTLHVSWGLPLVATIHATERGRSGGHISPGQPTAINSVEWWLTYEAARVICCSEFMRREVIDAFQLPPDKVDVVPNGVDPEDWMPPARGDALRGRRSPSSCRGDGSSTRRASRPSCTRSPRCAAPRPASGRSWPGPGPTCPICTPRLERSGVDDICDFPGFVPDDELKGLLHRASVAVIPSFYEPFGIVALEAMAAGAPVVAAASGGLIEVIDGTGAGPALPARRRRRAQRGPPPGAGGPRSAVRPASRRLRAAGGALHLGRRGGRHRARLPRRRRPPLTPLHG